MGTVALSVAVFYLFFSFRNAIAAPVLEVASPSDGMLSASREVVVRGRVSDNTKIFINAAPVVPRADGAFEVPLVLDEGLNTITVEAVRKNIRSSAIVRQVLVEKTPVSE